MSQAMSQWSSEADNFLTQLILNYGVNNWSVIVEGMK